MSTESALALERLQVFDQGHELILIEHTDVAHGPGRELQGLPKIVGDPVVHVRRRAPHAPEGRRIEEAGRGELLAALDERLASLSLGLRFWDLFAIRAVLYPLYIANAPRARYEGYAVRRLPVFQTVTFALNGGLTMAELQMREKR